MKFNSGIPVEKWYRRPPRGGRGLKYKAGEILVLALLSPPSRGAWIEIQEKTATALYRLSPPSRGAWIEIFRSHDQHRLC